MSSVPSDSGRAPPPRVLHVAAEIYPLVKTGGLADVVGALPPALVAHGVDARVLLPGLPDILAGMRGLEPLIQVGPAFGAGRVTLRRGRLPDSDVRAYVIDSPWLYARDGNPYLGPDGRDWPDNHRRFALLGWIAAQLAEGGLDERWSPQVLHAHDWHAGLAPAWLATVPGRRARSVFTVHNLAYQGLFPIREAAALRLPRIQADAKGYEYHGQLSFMKAGLVFADRITTVSPRYAHEICTAEFGCGLQGVLSDRRDVLSGILNGVDFGVWNPATDPAIAAHFDAGDLSGKAACKAALQRECGLQQDPAAPLFVVVSRLTDQKGMDLLLGALPSLVASGAQLAMLGSGDRSLQDAFESAARAWAGRVSVRIGYDEAFAHRLVAGGDAIVVPSRFEPCGLTQMYGLRYGTLPVVRRVGGLADTVMDASGPAMTLGTATGFTFDAATTDALSDALQRACAAIGDARMRETLMRRGMARNNSWAAASERYADLYRSLLAPAHG